MAFSFYRELQSNKEESQQNTQAERYGKENEFHITRHKEKTLAVNFIQTRPTQEFS